MKKIQPRLVTKNETPIYNALNLALNLTACQQDAFALLVPGC